MRSSIIFFIAIATLLISFVHAHGTENKDAVSAGKPSSGRAKLMRKRGRGGMQNSGGGSGRPNGASNSGGRSTGNAKPAGGGIGGGLVGGSSGTGGLLGGLLGGVV